jgi:Rrf2 family protein
MFSQTAEYALRAMVVLARNPDVPQTAQTIASESKIPHDYLLKVLGALNRADLVIAQRGRNGGFTLARDPEFTSILDVISAVDPMKRIKHCPLGLAEHRRALCSLHRKLDDAIRTVEETLAAATLASVLAEPKRTRLNAGGLCHVAAAN